MYIFDRWSPYSYQNNREKYADDDEKREFNMKECLWFCMTSLTPQGGGEAPKSKFSYLYSIVKFYVFFSNNFAFLFLLLDLSGRLVAGKSNFSVQTQRITINYLIIIFYII